MQRLETLSNQAPASPKTTDVAAVVDKVPALREPVLRVQYKDLVHPEGPAVVATTP